MVIEKKFILIVYKYSCYWHSSMVLYILIIFGLLPNSLVRGSLHPPKK